MWQTRERFSKFSLYLSGLHHIMSVSNINNFQSSQLSPTQRFCLEHSPVKLMFSNKPEIFVPSFTDPGVISMNSWQIQPLHLSGHPEDSVLFKISMMPLHPFQSLTQKKVVLPVSVWQVCFASWSCCRPPSSSAKPRNGCSDIPRKALPAPL